MPSTEKLDTHRKALSLNLDTSKFGSFAEIGAGQEVARWFLVVGGASGTVAKSVSAYDKEVSDSLYGTGSRYVSRQRLESMLETEWSQLLRQLDKTRGSETRFFSFVDTVSARNYAGTNDSHGWVGLRFQSHAGDEPSDILLHINMRDSSNILQQEAIGILGVNLIYAAFYQLADKGIIFRRTRTRRGEGTDRDRFRRFSRASLCKLGSTDYPGVPRACRTCRSRVLSRFGCPYSTQ